MGNRFREHDKEVRALKEGGGKYRIHWFRRVLVLLFIAGFWILYYWSQP